MTGPATPTVVGETRAFSSVKPLLHLEGLAAFVAGLVIYGHAGGDWLWLVPLLLVPDVSMVGYLAGPAVGSHVYNLAHNWGVGLAVLGAGAWLASAPLVLAGAVLIAHIGVDRLVGYGLKYPTHFKDTHLGHV